jgi:quercetin dioxygenase-like cupin family protein
VTKAIALQAQEGKSIWMLNHLMTFKATSQETDGAFALVEQTGNPGTGSPPHVHHGEDEFFFILEGEADFTLGGESIHGKTGTFLFLPRDIEHSFANAGTGPCRMLLGVTPGGFENFFAEMGEPATSLTTPAPSAPDIEKLLALAAKYNAEIKLPAPTA